MTYLCTGSNTTKAANREPVPDPTLPNEVHLNWIYASGQCQDCLHRFDFVPDSNPRSRRLVLPYHYEDGTLFERAVAEALKATVDPVAEADHLGQIRKALS
jgi:hypothetical protein